MPYLTGETDQSLRTFFHCTNDDGLVTAIWINDWKNVFFEQRAVWRMAGLNRYVGIVSRSLERP